MNALGVGLATVKLIEVALWAADLRALGCRIWVVGCRGHGGILSRQRPRSGISAARI